MSPSGLFDSAKLFEAMTAPACIENLGPCPEGLWVPSLCRLRPPNKALDRPDCGHVQAGSPDPSPTLPLS